MKHTGLAGLLVLVLAVPAAHADTNAFLRVEGKNATLLPRTAVTLPTTPESHTGCAGDSGSSALEIGTKGDWDHTNFVQTILGDTYDAYNTNMSWSFWSFTDGRFVPLSTGICDFHLAAGQELLASYQESDVDYNPTILPLWLTDVPAKVQSGVPFTVTVNRAECSAQYCADTKRVPGAGATVAAGGATATANADGKATLTLTSLGDTAVRATATKATASASEPVTVEAAPIYNVPTGPVGTATPAPTVTVTPDTTAPFSTIRGIKEQQVFRKRRKAPRTLKARVTDDTSVASVSLSITRQRGKKCTAFSDRLGRFVRIKCGKHPRFGVGSSGTVSYLLPKRLGRGRYVFDVVATDSAGNQEKLARGRNRVVFTVR